MITKIKKLILNFNKFVYKFFRVSFNKKDAMILIFFFFISLIILVINNQNKLLNQNEILRNNYGGFTNNLELQVNISDTNEKFKYNYNILPRRRTKKEADKIFNEIYGEIFDLALSKNESFNNIRNNLDLKTNYQDGIYAKWAFEQDNNKKTYKYEYTDLMDNNGVIDFFKLKEDETVNGYLILQLYTNISDDEYYYYSEKYYMPIKIIGKKNTIKEKVIKLLKKNENENLEKEKVFLPTNYEKNKIFYTTKFDISFLYFIFIGIFIVILLKVRLRKEEIDNKNKIIQSIEIDYSKIISKILIYVCSGINIKNAFILLSSNYKLQLKNNIIIMRKSIEIINDMANKLKNNENELEVYEKAGKDFNINTYIKLFNILSQNVKTGVKDLKNVLTIEVNDAFFIRKQKALRRTEEASTKLIIPLMLMFVIIVVVIIVPAFINM